MDLTYDTKRKKLDFNKIKNICEKNIIKKVKRQPTEGKKIFAYLVSDKSLLSRRYKELLFKNKDYPFKK